MTGVPFHEFKGNRRLLWIAEEWKRYADQLAEWALEHMANRRDVWSQYTLRNGEVGVVMLPVKKRRAAGADMVTVNKLRRHFAGRAVSHLIGLHSISDRSTARWFAIDIDLHDENAAGADEIAQANFEAAHAWSLRLRADLFDPILLDSNGVGGYHILVLLDDDYPLADVYDYVDDIRSEWHSRGLERKPEIFPPRREVEADDLPYTLRLPGRHHSKAHYSRVYNFDPSGEVEWLEGGEAIEALLAARPAPLPLRNNKSKAVPKPIRRTRVHKRKPRVCVDLDGVLARYEGWKGPDHIGPPIAGAVEFATSLSQAADIVIYTSRCSREAAVDLGHSMDPGRVRVRIVEWLERHKIPYSDVYVGQGKPRASAYIDDRAVHCSPQNDKEAFSRALSATRKLITRRKHRQLTSG